MLPPEIAKDIRRLEIATNRAVEEIVGGSYHSVFRGRGIEFDEVRPYTADDDVRNIDWNVTARTGIPYVKKYVEERELNVMLAVDVSASGDFAGTGKSKRRTASEIAALLAFSAAANADKVGLMLFSDRVERFVAPRAGRKHALRIIRELLAYEPESRGTDLAGALGELRKVMHKRGVVFVLSDFQTETAFARQLRILNRRHDVVAIRLVDPVESRWPEHGTFELEDAETGERVTFYGTSERALADYRETVAAESAHLGKICGGARVDLVDVACGSDPVKVLIDFFGRRKKRRTH